MAISDAFDRAAPSYDALRRRLIPCFDDFYAAALTLLGDAAGKAPRVLDLGAGTGLLSALILDRFPHARLTLIDLSEGMLALARRRFGGLAPDQVTMIAADYVETPLQGPYPNFATWHYKIVLEQRDRPPLEARMALLLFGRLGIGAELRWRPAVK